MTSPHPLLNGIYYHIYNRGVNRENIFIEERNYEYFLLLLTKHIEPVAELFAYCLLRNHFHLMVRVKTEEEIKGSITRSRSPTGTIAVPESNEVPGENYASNKFSNFFNAYAKGFNLAYGRTGSLFQHPFGRVMVTTDWQFWNVIAYIHQNPQKHHFVDDFRDWKYSSYGLILADKPSFLQRDTVLDWFGGKDQYLERSAEWVTDAQSNWFAADDLE